MKTSKIKLTLSDGSVVEAQAPLIVFASRATDIPAFYAGWFFNRLRQGYVRWRNPYNGKDSYVSFANTKFIVFWSKNPKPLLPFLPILKEMGIGCYIQYTERLLCRGIGAKCPGARRANRHIQAIG